MTLSKALIDYGIKITLRDKDGTTAAFRAQVNSRSSHNFYFRPNYLPLIYEVITISFYYPDLCIYGSQYFPKYFYMHIKMASWLISWLFLFLCQKADQLAKQFLVWQNYEGDRWLGIPSVYFRTHELVDDLLTMGLELSKVKFDNICKQQKVTYTELSI